MVIAFVLAVVAVAVWPSGGPADAPDRRVVARVRALRGRGRSRADHPGNVAACAEILAMCLTAGLTPARALGVLGERAEIRAAGHDVRVAVDAVAEATRVGEPAGHLWARHAPDVAGLHLLGAAWQLSERSGAALAPALEATAAALHDDRAAQQRISASAAGARTTMWLLTLLPAAGPLAAMLFGLSPVEVILGHPVAAVSTGIGVVLTVAGWRLSDHLLRRALRPPEVS